MLTHRKEKSHKIDLWHKSRERPASSPSWAKLSRDAVIAGLAFAYSVWAIWGSGQEWLAKGFMLLLFGIPVYVYMKWRESRKVGFELPPEPVVAEGVTSKVLVGID